jgi:hypothetical protein
MKKHSFNVKMAPASTDLELVSGAPGRSRTRNLTGRNRLLYPVELQGLFDNRTEAWQRPHVRVTLRTLCNT